LYLQIPSTIGDHHDIADEVMTNLESVLVYYCLRPGKSLRIKKVPCVKSGNHTARNIKIRHIAEL